MPKFNSVIYRRVVPSEATKAAVYASMHDKAGTSPVEKTSVITQDVLDKIPEGPILVLGAYYNDDSIGRLLEKGSVTVIFYGPEDLSKYKPGLVSYDFYMFTRKEMDEYPWLCRTARMIQGHGTPEDEAFHGGVMRQRTPEEIKNEDMFPVFERLVSGEYDEKKMISEGSL